LPQLPGERATISDWANHLSTIFPEVRLKTYLEMRGADAGPQDRILALPALFVGLFYDSVALDGAWDLVRGWSGTEREALRCDAPIKALASRIAGRSAQDVARDMLALARGGLRRRARLDASGADETIYLAPLEAIAESGRPLAVERLDAYRGRWGESVVPAFEECVLL
jgi:glutamate--cysteine ligase